MYNKSIELLNNGIRDELKAVHQYLYFHFHCTDQGLGRFAELFRKTALTEMNHVEKLSERVLFLKGDVDMNGPAGIKKVRSIIEMLETARLMEKESMQEYNQWAGECSANADAISRQIFESLVKDEEEHFNRFDIELSNIEKFGDNYLALNSMESQKS